MTTTTPTPFLRPRPCPGCHRPATRLSGFCSSTCRIATLIIRLGHYTTYYQGTSVRFTIQTRRHPTQENYWVAWTELRAGEGSAVLDLWEGAGQFAGEGKTEVDAVLDLIDEIEKGS